MVSASSSIKSTLISTKNRQELIKSCLAVIDSEVGKKNGLSGLAVKKGNQLVKQYRNGTFLPETVDWLLDEMVDCLLPYIEDYVHKTSRPTNKGLRDYLCRYDSQITKELLAITDDKAQRSANMAITASYKTLRPIAGVEVKRALPAVAAMISNKILAN